MQYWYHNIIKKYTVAMSYIFNDIHVLKYDDAGELQKDITVPITYYGKEKMISYINEVHSDFNTYDQSVESNYELKIGQIVPRIGFIDGAPVYDSARKKSQTQIIMSDDRQYEIGSPVPYNFPFDVSIYTKRKDDMNQIVEQILTLFTPDLVLTINEVPELGIKSNCPVILNSVTYNNTVEFGKEDNRVLITDLSFTLKGHLWPKVVENPDQKGIIHYIITNFKSTDCQEYYEKLVVDWKRINTITTSTNFITASLYPGETPVKTW